MAKKPQTNSQQAQNPLILHFHRLMDAFSKADDERDFYLGKTEGFILYIDLSKPQEDIDAFEKELHNNPEKYCLIPKFTLYEIKKIMEEFVNEKVYDIDTKEKLLDLIQSKDARENFLEFIYDHHAELEKWHQYYQERSRIRIIEWLRNHEIKFVFEEDLDLAPELVEKIKQYLFQAKVPKDVASARKVLESKAKTYYSNEALNPRPKRGRPPKQAAKTEVEVQVTNDVYMTVPPELKTFLYIPDITSAHEVTFSSKFETEKELLASLRTQNRQASESKLETIFQKLANICGDVNADFNRDDEVTLHHQVSQEDIFLPSEDEALPPQPEPKPKKAKKTPIRKKTPPKK
ncbi:MAG: UPF0158 family protein [Chlamydiota bacterium]